MLAENNQEQTFGEIRLSLSKGRSLMQSQWASVYRFSSHLVVCPESETTAGIRIAVEPFQVLTSPVLPIELGTAIHRALTESRKGIPQPTDWKALALPRLTAANVKTEAVFQKKSQLVSVELSGAALKITPHRNGGAVGATKGFDAAVEHGETVKDMSSVALGNAVFLAFEFCA